MSLNIGRCGTDVTLQDPDTASLSGNQLTLAGDIDASTVSDMLVLKQQLLGLVDSDDEPVVPIRWSENARYDGFYEVLDVQVELLPVSLATPMARWSGTFRRLPGYSYPLVQSVLTYFVRTNSHALSGTSANWWAWPSTATEVDVSNLADISSVLSRIGDDGTISLIRPWGFASADTVTSQFAIGASSYYLGACSFEVGSTLRTVVGRQADAFNGTATQWRLSNHLVRVTPNASAGKIDISHYDGSQWETVKTYTVNDRISGNTITAFNSVRVLRNTPESCSIRLGATSSMITGSMFIDLTLRRGARAVELFLSSNYVTGVYWQVRRNTAEASTAVTGGIRATANDASGNRFVIGCPSTSTTDLVNGRVGLTTAATTAQFCIGSEIGGSGAAAVDAAASVITDFVFVTAERQIVVGR